MTSNGAEITESDVRTRTHARRQQILTLIDAGQRSVDDLARTLDVSPSTVRRDLSALRVAGRIARTYGGALPASRVREDSLVERSSAHHRAKDAIARRAAAEIEAGDTIYLDGGTTVGAMMARLAPIDDLTIVTPAIDQANTLAALENATVIILGGLLRASSLSTVGSLVEENLLRLTFDKAFLGADAVHPEFGLCERDIDQTRIKSLVMSRSRQSYVLADSSKLLAAAFHTWAAPPAEWTLITEQGAPVGNVHPFEALSGCTVLLATGVAREE